MQTSSQAFNREKATGPVLSSTPIFYILAQSTISSIPVYPFLCFRDKSLKVAATREYPSILAIIFGIVNWITKRGGGGGSKKGASQKTAVNKM